MFVPLPAVPEPSVSPPETPENVCEVTLLKEPMKGLGIRIADQLVPEGRKSLIVIDEVFKGGPAHIDGRLKKGVCGCVYIQAISCMACCVWDCMIVTLCTKDVDNVYLCVHRSNFMLSDIISTCMYISYVAFTVYMSTSYISHCFIAGDVVVAVDGQSLEGQSHREAAKILKNAPTHVRLTIKRKGQQEEGTTDT